ncbi:MAG: helix-turn-helix transcriptional regulator, partial [Bacteroidota bacterium]
EGYHRKGVALPKVRPSVAEDRMEQLKSIADRIRRSMQEDHLYRNPELSRSVLAKTLAVKPYLISQALNDVMDTKFNDYINQLRIAELKRLMQSPQKSHYSLISLAYEAGFNSKASFHRAVRKYEGVSPGQLRDNGDNLSSHSGN